MTVLLGAQAAATKAYYEELAAKPDAPAIVKRILEVDEGRTPGG